MLYNRPSALSLAWWKFRGHNASKVWKKNQDMLIHNAGLEDEGQNCLANYIDGEHVNLP